MTEDLGINNWDEALKACAALGDGWRLPTRHELNMLFLNKEVIGGFALAGFYWSSSESEKKWAYAKNFERIKQNRYYYKSDQKMVRTVRVLSH